MMDAAAGCRNFPVMGNVLSQRQHRAKQRPQLHTAARRYRAQLRYPVSFAESRPEPMSDTSKQDIPSKVPEVTLLFWIIKIAATTLGETGGDAVTMTLDRGYLVGTAIFLSLLVVLVIVQILAKTFRPFLYWATIVASTTFGTTMADFADRSLGIGYTGGSLLLFVCLMAVPRNWIEGRKDLLGWPAEIFNKQLPYVGVCESRRAILKLAEFGDPFWVEQVHPGGERLRPIPRKSAPSPPTPVALGRAVRDSRIRPPHPSAALGRRAAARRQVRIRHTTSPKP